jgi:hypothetical protein
MKKIVLLCMTGITLLLAACETTKEISLNMDGAGTLVSTTDMSGLIGFAKMSGGGKDLEKMDGQAIDTVVALSDKVDSLSDLSPEDRALLKTGTLALTVDVKNEKLVTKLNLPFTEPGQIDRLDKLSAAVGQQVLKKTMDGAGSDAPPGMDNMLPKKSIDDYYNTTYSKGQIERKLDTTKYANVQNDEEMKALKQMASMGMGATKLIFNLPAPVKKATGKNLTVSDDKKVVTVMSSVEDFFEKGTDLEFRIEY